MLDLVLEPRTQEPPEPSRPEIHGRRALPKIEVRISQLLAGQTSRLRRIVPRREHGEEPDTRHRDVRRVEQQHLLDRQEHARQEQEQADVQDETTQIDPRSGAAPPLLPELGDQPLPPLTNDIESIERQHQRQQHPLEHRPAPEPRTDPAMLIIQREEGPEVAVIIHAHHIRIRVMRPHVRMCPISRRELKYQRIAHIIQNPIPERRARRGPVRRRVPNRPNPDEAKARHQHSRALSEARARDHAHPEPAKSKRRVRPQREQHPPERRFVKPLTPELPPKCAHVRRH